MAACKGVGGLEAIKTYGHSPPPAGVLQDYFGNVIGTIANWGGFLEPGAFQQLRPCPGLSTINSQPKYFPRRVFRRESRRRAVLGSWSGYYRKPCKRVCASRASSDFDVDSRSTGG